MRILLISLFVLSMQYPAHAIPAGLITYPTPPSCADLVKKSAQHDQISARLKRTPASLPVTAEAIVTNHWLTEATLEGLKSQAKLAGVNARLQGIGGHQDNPVSVWALNGSAISIRKLTQTSAFKLTDVTQTSPTVVAGLDKLERDGNAYLEITPPVPTQYLTALRVNTYFARRLEYLRSLGARPLFSDARSVEAALVNYQGGTVILTVKGKQIVVGPESLLEEIRAIDNSKLEKFKLPIGFVLKP